MPLKSSYSAQEAESRWRQAWQVQGTYQFEPQGASPVYSIDSPPPTVSGHLHLGHVYSYSQADFMARFFRMNGYNVFYPMGFDDNGLPTDRLVQKWKGITPAQVGRKAFIETCLSLGEEMGRDYRTLWERLGLSIDWRYTYRTIGDLARRTSQASFVELYHRGLVYQQEAPAIYCPECGISIAQADLDDLERPAEFFDLAFRTGSGKVVPIATTRPELLPACVAVFVHPQDDRHAELVGQELVVPYFGQRVPVLADVQADPTKGTGVVMCCTFGDQVDVEWWRTHRLPLKVALGREGRMTELAGEFTGQSIPQARRGIVAALEGQGLLLGRQATRQSVRVHERCDTPVEYLVLAQWFIRVLDHKTELLALGEQVRWRPEHMGRRYREWVENLHWDWCLSRQRVFGVPFPAWRCARCAELRIANLNELPVDPMESQPAIPCACGSSQFIAEPDVMDTWATSSMSPQIVGQWLEDPSLFEKVFPFSLRPQAHEIIRTWAFYTIVKSYFHFGRIPWADVGISGWGLAPQGSGKISKSKGGGPIAPLEMINRYSADAVRYWSASTGFGRDSIISEEKIQAGAKLATKLWNVARFSERFITGYQLPDAMPNYSNTDRWLLARLQSLVQRVTELFTDYDYAPAKNEIETFFWRDLADNYLEMAKQRLYDAQHSQRAGAVDALYRALLTVVKLLAPFLPYLTEEIYTGLFASSDAAISVHRSAWPRVEACLADAGSEKLGEGLLAAAGLVRQYKSERSLSVGAKLARLHIVCHDAAQRDFLRGALDDLKSVTRADVLAITEVEEAGMVYSDAENGIRIAVD